MSYKLTLVNQLKFVNHRFFPVEGQLKLPLKKLYYEREIVRAIKANTPIDEKSETFDYLNEIVISKPTSSNTKFRKQLAEFFDKSEYLVDTINQFNSVLPINHDDIIVSNESALKNDELKIEVIIELYRLAKTNHTGKVALLLIIEDSFQKEKPTLFIFNYN